jgi:hypothetical protein
MSCVNEKVEKAVHEPITKSALYTLPYTKRKPRKKHIANFKKLRKQY